MLVGWLTIHPKRADQCTEARRQNDQITGARCGAVGVRNASGNEYRLPSDGDFRPVRSEVFPVERPEFHGDFWRRQRPIPLLRLALIWLQPNSP